MEYPVTMGATYRTEGDWEGVLIGAEAHNDGTIDCTLRVTRIPAEHGSIPLETHEKGNVLLETTNEHITKLD